MNSEPQSLHNEPQTRKHKLYNLNFIQPQNLQPKTLYQAHQHGKTLNLKILNTLNPNPQTQTPGPIRPRLWALILSYARGKNPGPTS